MADLRVHDGPIWVFTMAGIRKKTSMYSKIACSAVAREGKSTSWMSSALMVLQKL